MSVAFLFRNMEELLNLLISEKPSVAQVIAKVLGVKTRRDGYIEGGDWLISWCVGHLVELAPADAYDPRYSHWDYADLPIVPQEWQYQVLPGTKKQFETLSRLMADERVDTIICATDAGREGELIFRWVYNMCGCTKPVKRLWISSMEESAILKGLNELTDSAHYDRLYDAALCRAKADWLIGINGTRLFSTVYGGRTLNVGRVVTPTLALLVERDAAISSFKKEKFYTVELDLSNFRAVSERFSTRAEAEKVRAAIAGRPITVRTVEQQKKRTIPQNSTILPLYSGRLTACSITPHSRRWIMCRCSMKSVWLPIPAQIPAISPRTWARACPRSAKPCRLRCPLRGTDPSPSMPPVC